MKTTPELLLLVAQTIYDKKGSNILALDVRGVSNVADYFILAEGRVDRHVKSLAKSIVDVLAEAGEKPLHVEGLQDGEWVAIDYWHFIIHLFTPSAREIYRIEGAWPKATFIDLAIDMSKSADDGFE